MFEVEMISGEKRRINFRQLVRLSQLMDWQIKKEGYDPISVTSAFLLLENIIESAQYSR